MKPFQTRHPDCIVVGASFAGLSCATALAGSGLDVTVLERKTDPGEKLRTTGILVKDALDRIPLLDGLPPELVRRIDTVRLYAPNMTFIDLTAPGYYFLATDTPNTMRWLAEEAKRAGTKISCRKSFECAVRQRSHFNLGVHGTARYLVGADGARSRVAKTLGLGQNRRFLFGVEHEYEGLQIADSDKLHCFIDRRIAPGYIGWVLAGVNEVQVGLACRVRGRKANPSAAMSAFKEKIAPVFDFRKLRPASVRAGMIPCGGIVRPVASQRALLIGDAAGMVSPVTAGGIHTAMMHGLAAGHAIADFLNGRAADPSDSFVASYPKFRGKRLLRFLYDNFQSDTAFNLLLKTQVIRDLASQVYFHRKAESEPRQAGAMPSQGW